MKQRESQQRVRRERSLTVYLFNVGQGDHILLRLPNEEYGIIDFHYGSGLPSPPALGYLQKLRRRLNQKTPIVLSFICLSHPDYDHVKGVKALLDWVKDKKNNVQLKNLWMWPGNILEELTEQYRDYGNSVEKSDRTTRATEVGLQLRALFNFRDSSRWSKVKVQYLRGVEKVASNAGGVKAVALAPLGKHIKAFDRQAQRDFVRLKIEGEKDQAAKQDPTAKQNLLSSILMLIYGGHRLLFGGDTGGDIWRQCLDYYSETEQHLEHGPFKGCFVKASHHGSKHSSSTALWPSILLPGAHVGISAGSKNRYGHPHGETLEQILVTFKKLSDRPKIWATNTCHECIITQHLPVKQIDWVLAERPSLDPLVEKSFEHYRWKLPGRSRHRHALSLGINPPNLSHMNLAAYIFRFEPGADAIKVYMGLSARVVSDEECIYKNNNSLPFPLCALRKSKQNTGS